MKRRLASAVALMAVLVAPAWAGEPTEQLRGFFDSTTKILDDPATEGKPEERFRAVLRAVGQIFDFAEAARLSLGPAWNARTPVEREEFVRLFTDLLQRSFVLGIAGRIHLGDGVKVSYLDESVGGAGATVWTTIEGKRGLDLPFTYRMIERGRGWAVRDVVIDGMSVAANYRAQFARILQAGSYPDLVQQLRTRLSTPLDGLGALMPQALAHVALLPTPLAPAMPLWPAASIAPAWTAIAVPTPSAPSLADIAMPTLIAPPLPAMALATRPAPTLPTNALATTSLAQTAPRAVALEPLRDARVALRVPPASGRAFWVQVGAFKDPDGAQRLAGALREDISANAARSAVVVDRSPAIALTRVRVGPFADRAGAATQLRVLETRGYLGYKPFIAPESD